MSKRFLVMAPECDICFLHFDLDHHRPKVLPCGHTICKECIHNPALESNCPTCNKDLSVHPSQLADNVFVIRMLEESASPLKQPRREDPRLVQLQQGVEAGRKLVQMLGKAVPRAVVALNRLLDSSVAQLAQLEEVVEKLQRGEDEEASLEDTQLPELLEDSLRLMASNRCTVVAEEGGNTWKSTVQLGPIDHVLRLLLLQLRSRRTGQLQKIDDVVNQPNLSLLCIDDDDLDPDTGCLRVDEILRNGPRWKNVRILKNLQGQDVCGTVKLLRFLAPHLEELEISVECVPQQLEEVKEMGALRKLLVTCALDCDDYPDLPLQLEELSITFPNEKQLRCVQRMPRLRSLAVIHYFGPDVSFLPRRYGGLLWLSVSVHDLNRDTMLSLIRANGATLQELSVFAVIQDTGDSDYSTGLAVVLSVCGLRSLRRLVLQRQSSSTPCAKLAKFDVCLLQRQALRGVLPAAVEVVCYACHKEYVLGG